MIKIENVNAFGLGAAIRGMRNPMNSNDNLMVEAYTRYLVEFGLNLKIGQNDLELMKKLVKAGGDYSKFMRMIKVTLDITAPLYWWEEFDTYKAVTVRNSCSTMHTIAEKEFTLDDFSHEHLISEAVSFLSDIIDCLNDTRNAYMHYDEEKDKLVVDIDKKGLWWQMIQLLPSSYNLRATVHLNYAVLRDMYHSRKNHELDEWVEFCKWVETLPYFELITM